jgi:hypothetical protein
MPKVTRYRNYETVLCTTHTVLEAGLPKEEKSSEL